MEIKSACGFSEVFDGSIWFVNLEDGVLGTVKGDRIFVFDPHLDDTIPFHICPDHLICLL